MGIAINEYEIAQNGLSGNYLARVKGGKVLATGLTREKADGYVKRLEDADRRLFAESVRKAAAQGMISLDEAEQAICNAGTSK